MPGFSPDNMKLDGAYHRLKVKRGNDQKWAWQSRRGYFAPRGELVPATAANESIQQALHPQAELQDVPVECQAQFTEGTNGASLSVVAQVDTKGGRPTGLTTTM